MADKQNEQTKMRLIKILNKHTNDQAISVTDYTYEPALAIEKLNEVILRREKPIGEGLDLFAIIRPTSHEDYGNLTITSNPSNNPEMGGTQIKLPYLFMSVNPGILHLQSSSGKLSLEGMFMLLHGSPHLENFEPLKLGSTEYHGHNKSIDSVMNISIKGVDTARNGSIDLPHYIRLCKGKIYLVEGLSRQEDVHAIPLKAQVSIANYKVR